MESSKYVSVMMAAGGCTQLNCVNRDAYHKDEEFAIYSSLVLNSFF